MKKHKVLVVDDDSRVLNALKREINSFKIAENLDLYFFESPGHALNFIECNDDIVLVISDLKMPGISGDDLLMRMRNLVPDSSAILLSAYSDMAAITKSIGTGLVSFLHKPWNSFHLMNEISRGVEMCTTKRIMKQYIREINRELNYYGEFQRSLMLNGLPRHEKLDFDAHTVTLPHHNCSSDFYTVIKTDKNRFIYLLADGDGPGFKASSKTIILRTLLNEFLDDLDDLRNLSPGPLLDHLNSRIYRHTGSSGSETIQCCALMVDLDFLNITVAGGGGIVPLINRSASTFIIDVNGPSLGSAESHEYGEVMETLVPGDRIVMYSDGLGKLHESYGVVHRLIRNNNMNDSFIDDVFEELSKIQKGGSAGDDMTILSVKFIQD